MKWSNDWVCTVAASVLILLPSLAVGQSETDDPDPGLTAYSAGDFRKAHDLWQSEALTGNPKSQYYLGYLYHTGQGVDVDYDKAFSWYNEAASNQCRVAECNLANLYMNGSGIAVDHGEAIRHFANCVKPGGMCNEQVVRMREYVQERLTWYSAQGYADAEYELASMALDQGDFVNAAAWLHKAAQRGHGPAQVALADSYLNGLGIDRDTEQGAQLLFAAMIEHRDNPAVLRSAKTTLAAAYHAGAIGSTTPAISTYVWARLALEAYPDTDSLPGAIYKQMAVDASNAMTDAEISTALSLASTWSELFTAGLPGVTEEHLQALRLPQ